MVFLQILNMGLDQCIQLLLLSLKLQKIGI